MDSIVTLRPATLTDLDAIMAIETSVFGAEAWSSAAMARDVGDRYCHYVVACSSAGDSSEAGDVVGYAGLLCPPGAGDGDIQTIAVSPSWRGQGLGRRLMQALLAEASERRASRLFLEVRADNDTARALYASLGFVEIAARPGYYQPEGVDAIVMLREEVARESN
jgi:ribosomal-protein-alanine N-acetyltransferase